MSVCYKRSRLKTNFFKCYDMLTKTYFPIAFIYQWRLVFKYFIILINNYFKRLCISVFFCGKRKISSRFTNCITCSQSKVWVSKKYLRKSLEYVLQVVKDWAWDNNFRWVKDIRRVELLSFPPSLSPTSPESGMHSWRPTTAKQK